MTRTFTAEAPYAPLARLLMDHGFRLCPREDVQHEYARLGKPNRDDPAHTIIIFRCGHVLADTDQGAALLTTIAGVPR
jgi:hypothetical protein